MRSVTALLFLATAVHVASAGVEIETFAGTGEKGFSGDGGPATAAQLNNPFGIARGADGAVYICDCDNQRIRKVTADGVIHTIAGNGTRGYSGDGGPAAAAALNEPYEVRSDAVGNVFFVERLNHCVRRVDGKTGVISTIAGNGKPGFSGDGGPATQAQMNEPHSIGFDSAGDLFICDVKNHRIRKMAMKSGLISTFAGTGEKKSATDGALLFESSLNGPRALDFDRAGNLWLALREGNAIYRLSRANGTLWHVAGTGGKPGFAGNGGPARQAVLGSPKGLSIGPNGKVFFADTESHSIRVIDVERTLGEVTTVELIAGTGQKGDGPAGDPLQCKLARPHGVYVDADGAIFIGDSENHRVRVIRLLSP